MPRSKPYSLILVAVDFSKPSVAALRHAIDLARSVGARVELVNVVAHLDPSVPFSKTNTEIVRRLQKEQVAEARQQLEGLIPRAKTPEVRARVLTGKPSRKIIDHARRVGADLIVLASRGHDIVEKALLGSTAERVLRGTNKPVLLVPGSRR